MGSVPFSNRCVNVKECHSWKVFGLKNVKCWECGFAAVCGAKHRQGVYCHFSETRCEVMSTTKAIKSFFSLIFQKMSKLSGLMILLLFQEHFYFISNGPNASWNSAFAQPSNIAVQQEVIWICINFRQEFTKEACLCDDDALRKLISFITVFITSSDSSNRAEQSDGWCSDIMEGAPSVVMDTTSFILIPLCGNISFIAKSVSSSLVCVVSAVMPKMSSQKSFLSAWSNLTYTKSWALSLISVDSSAAKALRGAECT